MLSIRSLTYQYAGSDLLSWPDFEVPEGEALVLLGPSGSGKTTLIHLISGLLRPRSGKIIFDEIEQNQLSKNEMDRFRGSNMGILFQQTHYWSSLSLLENVQLAVKMSGAIVSKEDILKRFEHLGISHLAQKKPQYCSVGERQRLGVALATMHDPKLVLADEPTSALDEKNCCAALELLKDEVVGQKRSLLIITHDQRVTEYFDRVIKLEETQ